jgi:hypothetical protein
MALKPSIRFEIFKRDAFTCVYCGQRSPAVILEVDHVLALSLGGRDEPDNLVTSCQQCNQGKAARVLGGPGPGLQPAERSARIAEHQAQISEYAGWLAFQRDREDEELRVLRDVFRSAPYAHFLNKQGVDTWFWQDASARIFIRRLGSVEVLDAIDIAGARFQPEPAYGRHTSTVSQARALQFWKFFCGICWRKIKNDGPRP